MSKDYTFKKLNLKHKRFCEEYVETGHLVDSYLAIYKTNNIKTANNNRFKLMKHDLIKEYISELEEDRKEHKKEQRDKWAEKRDNVLNKLYDRSMNNSIRDRDAINASRKFLQYISRYEEFVEKDEETKDKIINNQFELLTKMVGGESIDDYDNLTLSKEEGE